MPIKSESTNSASKNPVKAAFKLIQQVWDQQITVRAFDAGDNPKVFRFKYLEIIGNGTFGIVCRAQDLDTKEIVAVKTVYQDEGHQNRELAIIKSLDHPNIVKIKRYFYTTNEIGEEFLSLVLEYMPTSLDKLLKEVENRKETLPKEIIQMCMSEFLKSLQYLHSKGICHRDIKPHNILVDLRTCTVKLCDFGCSKRLIEGEPNIQYICARYYRAPEIVFSWAYYTCSIDIWSAGCVMAEMFTGKPLFPGKNSVDQLAKIVKVLGPPTPDDLVAMGQQARKTANINKPSLTPEQTRRLLEESFLAQGIPVSAVDLLLEMLRYDPIKRIKATDSLNHPFFATMGNPPKIDGPAPVISQTTPNSSRRHYKSGPQPS